MSLTKRPSQFKKFALFTDIHFGRRNNSRVHNEDCLAFVKWFCKQVKLTPGITHVGFLGDWFESRSAINIETLEYSYRALREVNDLGFPVYFMVGNHDLHRRTTREVHSVRMFNELSNFNVIDKVHVEDEILFAPYLFEEEYPALLAENHRYAFLGHFEFRNFQITGHNVILERGADHRLLSGPKRIISGHFHKRQSQDNVHYMGNVFPMDFGDAGDSARGMAFYEVAENKLTYRDWAEGPRYQKTFLSSIIKEEWNPVPNAKVKCIVDTEISYQEVQELRDYLIAQHSLRDLIFEEDRAAKQGLLEGENVKVTEQMLDFTDVDDLVIKQLEGVKGDKRVQIDPKQLIEIYKELHAEVTPDD